MKHYIHPSLKISEIVIEQLMVTSVFVDDDYSTEPQLGNGRRGSWGDLWFDGEQE